MDITKCGYFLLHQMWQHLEYYQMWLLLTPPNVATFGVLYGYYQMWLLPNVAKFGVPMDITYSTKCGNIWSTYGYYQIWLLPNVAKFGVPMDITKCGYFLLHQMWQNLEYLWILPNVATSKCGKIWSRSTHGYYQMWLLPTPPNVATFGVPTTSAYSTKCGNIWSTHGYYQMWLLLTPPNVANIWSTHGYYQMWLLLTPWILILPIIINCGYFCTFLEMFTKIPCLDIIGTSSVATFGNT